MLTSKENLILKENEVNKEITSLTEYINNRSSEESIEEYMLIRIQLDITKALQRCIQARIREKIK